MEEWGVRRVASPGTELRKWRTRRQLSLRALASRVNGDFGHLGKIEKGKATFTQEMAKVCDLALDAGGALIHAWTAAQGSVRPAQLPAAPVLVVGRDRELAALAQAVGDRPLGTPGVVAIDGPAGAGKTALALRLAHQIADQYVDGQLYADLGGFAPAGKSVTAHAVLEGFLTAMGASTIPDSPAERAALYRSLLAERDVLIVLDNVADLDDVTQLLPASPGCAVVVTSRRALSSLVTRVGATLVTVRPLAVPDSITLVSRVIGEARAAADTDAVDAVATLIQLCGHLPLALCIAAEQIAMYPYRRVADLVDELIEEEHRLSAWEITDLRTVFSWSYHDLSDDAARLFRLLGLHPGPHLSVAAAAALADVSTPRARRLLHQLASLHLVDIDSEQTIRLPDLIRAYARDLVNTDDASEQRHAAIQRLVAWYAATVHAASPHLSSHMLEPPPPASPADNIEDSVTPLVFPDETAASTWCAAELDNFGPISTLALQYGPPDAAHQLATGLADLGLLDRTPDEPASEDAEPTTTTTSRTSGAAGSAGSTGTCRMEPSQPPRPDNGHPDGIHPDGIHPDGIAHDTGNNPSEPQPNDSSIGGCLDGSVDGLMDHGAPWTRGPAADGPLWASADELDGRECRFGEPRRNHGPIGVFGGVSGGVSGEGGNGRIGETQRGVARVALGNPDDHGSPWRTARWTEAENPSQSLPSPRTGPTKQPRDPHERTWTAAGHREHTNRSRGQPPSDRDAGDYGSRSSRPDPRRPGPLESNRD